MVPFLLSYDYRCPFAKNMHLHLIAAQRAGAHFDVTFVPWTMSQGHKPEGAPDVWADEKQDKVNLALTVSISVRDQQPDLFLDAHEALFRARHELGLRLNDFEQLRGILTPLGVDMDLVAADLATRRPHQVLGDSFALMATYEAFGVPTFVVNHDATFVRYMKPPTDDAAASKTVIDTLVTLMERNIEINEFKHTKVPN
jgi:predicted DsbA family dithiol-disulfide isomerase